jgi:hypothetical protein
MRAQDTARVYRIYGANNRLLYVGMSANPLLRLDQHSRASAWADEATSVTIGERKTKADALLEEADAIRSEKPVFNTNHRQNHLLRQKSGSAATTNARVPKRKQPPALLAHEIAHISPDPTKMIEITDGAVRGLKLRVYPSGRSSWSLQVYDYNGNRRRFHIGESFIGLSEARKRAERMRVRVRDEGYDPAAEKRMRRKAVGNAG